MGSVNGFFRRNSRIFWVLGSLMIGAFIVVQFGKAISSPAANYSFASECTYYLKPTVEQKPLTREQSVVRGCTSG